MSVYIKATAELLAGCAKHAVDCWERGLNDGPDRRAIVLSPVGDGRFRYACLDLDRVYEVEPDCLLLDLSIPAVRDRVARVLFAAARPDMKAGMMAPGWFCWEYPEGSFWSLRNAVVFCESIDVWETVRDAHGLARVLCVEAPGIPGSGHGEEALALAWKAVQS